MLVSPLAVAPPGDGSGGSTGTGGTAGVGTNTPQAKLDAFKNNPTEKNWGQLSIAQQQTLLGGWGASNPNFKKFAKIYFDKLDNIGSKPKIDYKYFGDKSNLGKNPKADDKFFSGKFTNGGKGHLSKFIQASAKNKEAAAAYFNSDNFKKKTGLQAKLSLDVIKGFYYDTDKGEFSNGVVTIPIKDYATDDYKGIRTTKDGFCFVETNNENSCY